MAFVGEGVCDFCLEVFAENALVAFFEFFPQVDDLDGWEGGCADAFGQFDGCGGKFFGGFDAGRGGAENDFAFGGEGLDFFEDAMGMVARGVFLFVGAFVFFVDDDEAEVLEGAEDCGA